MSCICSPMKVPVSSYRNKNNEQSILAPLVTRNTVVLVGMEKLWEDYVATLVDNFGQKPEDGQYIEKKSDALFDDPTGR